MTARTTSVTLGGAVLIVTYEVHGFHAPETVVDPEEWPEIELTRLETEGGEDVSGLLGFDPLYEHALEEIDEQEREANYGREPDPDDAYDRSRDERLEQA